MDKLLYGTSNPAKLSSMRKMLESLDIEIIGLNDLNKEIPEVLESGNTPLENARQKAMAYWEAFHMPVFSCDSGLYFDNVPDEIQPGLYIRRVGGRSLTDEEMIAYYSQLAKQYGDLKASYKNAICFIADSEHIYEAMEPSMAGEKFIITSKPHRRVEKGFPLDSLSVDMETGKYYYDLQGRESKHVEKNGFLEFFEKHLGKL